jgi:hypothetical protein
MLGLSLHSWENVMLIFLGVAALAAAVVGVSTYAVVQLQKQESAEAKADLEAYKVEASEKVTAAKAVGETANANAAQAVAETAKANERTAGLARETELLRQKNLELEDAVSPRRLEQGAPSRALKKFAGMQVFITVAPEFESRRFAAYLQFMFSMAEWKTDWIALPEHLIRDGIEIEYLREVGYVAPDGPEKTTALAAEALLEEFKKQKIDARTKSMPTHSLAAKRRPTEVPPDAIVVKVGAKPDLASLRFERKMLEEQEAARAKILEDIKKRFPQSWPEAKPE